MHGQALDPVELLKNLIAFDTSNLPGNELPCAQYLADLLAGYGFAVTLQKSPDDPTRANVIASIGNPAGKTLLFNGHLDVVPVSDGWTSDPFKAEIRDGKLYGRGASDMKGGVAAMTAAAIQLAVEKFPFAGGRLVLMFDYDEELHGLGIKQYIASPEFVKADFAVISEPTSLDCCIANRGVTRYTLTIHGQSCHAGVPHKGVNAISMAGLAIQALDDLAGEIAKRSHPVLPAPTLAQTIISGGTKDNIVPNAVEIKMDRRTLPDETVESCLQEIVGAMEALKKRVPEFSYDVESYVTVGAGYLPAEHELVGLCDSVNRRLFGKPITVRDFSACNEQYFLLGAGVPAVVLGPGHIDQAHTVDEFVSVEELGRCADFFRELAKDILR